MTDKKLTDLLEKSNHDLSKHTHVVMFSSALQDYLTNFNDRAANFMSDTHTTKHLNHFNPPIKKDTEYALVELNIYRIFMGYRIGFTAVLKQLFTRSDIDLLTHVDFVPKEDASNEEYLKGYKEAFDDWNNIADKYLKIKYAFLEEKK